jgi:hypothetical protein
MLLIVHLCFPCSGFCCRKYTATRRIASEQLPSHQNSFRGSPRSLAQIRGCWGFFGSKKAGLKPITIKLKLQVGVMDKKEKIPELAPAIK